MYLLAKTLYTKCEFLDFFLGCGFCLFHQTKVYGYVLATNVYVFLCVSVYVYVSASAYISKKMATLNEQKFLYHLFFSFLR